MLKHMLCLLSALSFTLIAACATTETVSPATAKADLATGAEKGSSSADGDLTKTAAATADEKSEADDNRVICKRRPVTGSRFPKKECRTWREWKQIEDNSRALVEGNQRASRFNTPAGGGR
ncbi:MAG: hypothetical protein AAFY83_02655, partial [Pseudomonadota bacterium]